MKSKFNSYLYSQKILTIASGNSYVGLHTKLSNPMINERMDELDRLVKFFIKKMEVIYSKDKYTSDSNAMCYFVNNIQSSIIDKYANLSPNYNRVRQVNGIFSINDKQDPFTKTEDILINFNVLVENWLSDLSYFSDRWCYERFVCFKLKYYLIKGRWEGLQYSCNLEK